MMATLLHAEIHLLDSPRYALVRRAGMTEEEIAKRVRARDAARKAKNFAAGDGIREELAAKGVLLMDGPLGTEWRPGPRLDVASVSRE